MAAARSGALRRAGALLWGLALVAACSESTVTPLSNTSPTSGSCVYPRACYLVDTSQCGDCVGGPDACRRVLSESGELVAQSRPPAPDDPAIVCPPRLDGGALPALACALPETVCVARGVACEGHCVRAGQDCDSGVAAVPQRSPSRGGGTYCPYTDDVCCPGAMDMSADMPAGDGGADAGPGDAATTD